ncbi:hypothetical protein Tco_0261995 [Tanacetum coccineum]
MAGLTFADLHNMVAYLEKSTENADFAEIVDFLNANPISSKSNAWNEFGTNITSALIYLAKNQKFNFSKLIFDGKVTPLFETMLIQQQADMGEGSGQPTDPQHVTEIPQSSEPTTLVADEAVHEERGDSVERAATTATSLDAEQDSGNINRTQSMAMPNDPLLKGIGSGGRPRRQETIGDKPDRLKLKELMEICTKLSERVLDLEKAKTAQAKDIASLKKNQEVGK